VLFIYVSDISCVFFLLPWGVRMFGLLGVVGVLVLYFFVVGTLRLVELLIIVMVSRSVSGSSCIAG